MNHLKAQHSDYVRIYDVKHPTIVSTQTKQIWYWMKKVVIIPEPVTYVENPIERECSAYDGISSDTLKKYMCIFIMFKKIKPEIQIADDKFRNFGIIYDGWTHDSEHYLAMFASFF